MRAQMLGVLLVASSGANAFWNFEEILAAGGGYATGQSLYSRGKGNAALLNYVAGVHDADTIGQPIDGKYCVPDEVRLGQLADVAYKYLDETPEKRHLTAAHLVRQAFRKAFPCPPEPGKR